MSTDHGAAGASYGGRRPIGRLTVAPPSRPPAPPPPLRPAIALAIIMALVVLGQAVGVGVWLLAPNGVDIPAEAFRSIVLAVVVVALALVGAGLSLAALVLSILVAVQGRGALRLGALLLLASRVGGAVLSFDIPGDPAGLPAAMLAAASIAAAFEIALAVVTLVLDVAGLLLLVRGIREIRADRSSRG